MEIFDEDKAVDFIKQQLAKNENITKKYGYDQIIEVIDMIWDYYEDHGLLSLDMAEEDAEAGDDAPEKDKLVEYVTRMVRKDRNSPIAEADIPALVEAELAYEALCDEI